MIEYLDAYKESKTKLFNIVKDGLELVEGDFEYMSFVNKTDVEYIIEEEDKVSILLNWNEYISHKAGVSVINCESYGIKCYRDENYLYLYNEFSVIYIFNVLNEIKGGVDEQR